MLQELSAIKSLREIAQEDFGGKVNHAVIQRCMAGQEPRKPGIRKALGLPRVLSVPFNRDPVTGRYLPLNNG